jgi:uncharacterized coiled-coil protein SlyX
MFALLRLGPATITERAAIGYGRRRVPRGIVAAATDGAATMTADDDKNRAVARIDELEVRLAQQDQAILELSDELYRQQRHIARLEAEIGRLADRMKALGGAEPAPGPADEVPPHY